MSKIIEWDDKQGARRSRDLKGYSQNGYFISPEFEGTDKVLKKDMKNIQIKEKQKPTK